MTKGQRVRPATMFSTRSRRGDFGAAVRLVWLVLPLTTVSVVRVLKAPKAVASASFHMDFPASAVVGGDPRREWLLPDKTAGWLDLYLSPRREVGRLHILNSENAPYFDRATSKLRVEVYFDDELRQTHRVTFEGPHTREVEIEIGAPADRIRLVVETWSGLGGGLGEVEVL